MYNLHNGIAKKVCFAAFFDFTKGKNSIKIGCGQKRKRMNKDLTVGDPFKVLTKFCLPLFGSIIFQQLYNIADSFVAGKFISDAALAAVGNSYEITLIFIAFAFGCNIGCSVIVSTLFGAKNYSEMKTAVITTFIASAVLCALLMVLGIAFCGDLLRLIQTPPDIFDDSALYLDIYMYGLPFVFFYNIATGVFSALGDSKTPFIFLAVSSVSNIGADILFVAAFGMGVDGVAWATFICQGVSCVLAMVFVFIRLSKIKTAEKVKPFSFPVLKNVMIVAIPSILQQSFVSVGNIVIQGVINGFGTEVIAGYSACIKLNNIVITSLVTLANGISNYTSQNIGAQKYLRVKEGFKSGIKLVWAICFIVVALYEILARYLMMIFLENGSGLAMDTGVSFLRIVSPFYFVVALKLVADGVLRGSRMMASFTISTFTDLIIRVALAEILSATALGTTGIWIAWPIGWCISVVVSLLFYRRGVWNKKQSAEAQVTE